MSWRMPARTAAAIAALLAPWVSVSAQQPAPSRPADASETTVSPDPARLDRFTGYYQIGPRSAVRFSREDTRLYLAPVGRGDKREVVAEGPGRFVMVGMPITISFQPDDDGAVTEAVINQAGRDIKAPRISEEAANALVSAAQAPTPPAPRYWEVSISPHRVVTSVADTLVDYWPVFGPDGRSILFSRSPDGGRSWSLLRVPSAGGSVETIFERAGVAVTRASIGHGQRIAFNAGNAIWTMDASGGNARPIPLEDMIAPSYASWYPDGRNVALVDGARNIIYRVEVATGVATPVNRQAEVLAGMPSVSPDGRWVAFAGQRNSGQVYNQNDNQIWLVDEAGAARPVESTPGPGRTPAWSPDGTRLAFESSRGSADGRYAIFIINRDGSDLRQVTDYALNGNHPSWSTDGKQLVISWGSQPGVPNGIAVIDVPD